MEFANSEAIDVVRQPDLYREYLILIRAGSKRRPSFFSEAPPERRNYDVGVNYYAKPHQDDELVALAELMFIGGLSKMHGAKKLFQATNLHLKYRGILFLDDDVEILFNPDKFFAFCEEYNLDLAQPALTPDCTDAIGISRQHPGLKLRTTNWVEVMAPFFRRDFLLEMLHSFDMSISTWGLDLYWGHHLGERWKGGIVDDFLMRHTNPSDHSEGEFYKYLKSLNVDPREEMGRVLASIGLKSYEVRPLTFVYHTYKFGF